MAPFLKTGLYSYRIMSNKNDHLCLKIPKPKLRLWLESENPAWLWAAVRLAAARGPWDVWVRPYVPPRSHRLSPAHRMDRKFPRMAGATRVTDAMTLEQLKEMIDNA